MQPSRVAPPLLGLQGPPPLAALPAPPRQAALPVPPAPCLTASLLPTSEPKLAIAATPHSCNGTVTPTMPAVQNVGNAGSTTFMPSYEWAAVPEGAGIPPGLEVRLPVDGTGHRTARIPPSWRMLVVAFPANESCRLDVTRHMPLAEVRAGIASALADGDLCRVESLLVDNIPIASSNATENNWGMTVEQAKLFGRRITCTLMAPKKDFAAQMDAIEAAVAEVERALLNSNITVGRATAELARLESELERLQCKGIDSASGGDSDASKLQRRQLCHRSEVLQARLDGIFIGLKATAMSDAVPKATPVSVSAKIPTHTQSSAKPKTQICLQNTSTPALAANRILIPTNAQISTIQPYNPTGGMSPTQVGLQAERPHCTRKSL